MNDFFGWSNSSCIFPYASYWFFHNWYFYKFLHNAWFFFHIFIVVSFALQHHLFILQVIFGAFSLSPSILWSFVLRNWPTLSSFDFLTLIFLFTMPYPEALVAGVSGRLKYFQLQSLKLRSQYIEYHTVKVTYLQCCS